MKAILILITIVLVGACERRPGASGINPEYVQRQEEQKNRAHFQQQMDEQKPILEENYRED